MNTSKPTIVQVAELPRWLAARLSLHDYLDLLADIDEQVAERREAADQREAAEQEGE